MDMTGQQRIPASREVVWTALNDPAVLQACIPGCQELVKSSDTQMAAVALIKVGPVTAKFQGAVTLSDFDPPNGYRITVRVREASPVLPKEVQLYAWNRTAMTPSCTMRFQRRSEVSFRNSAAG